MFKFLKRSSDKENNCCHITIREAVAEENESLTGSDQMKDTKSCATDPILGSSSERSLLHDS
ncbi:hypothetical protein [Mesobacillus harenae]|uniref:hypothetical protein n=1 Tax=Mesobacillus harenae TaxID=2213203 RepID=UPI0015803944|nr:hypothetical protein [Mesobacillus harenae]